MVIILFIEEIVVCLQNMKITGQNCLNIVKYKYKITKVARYMNKFDCRYYQKSIGERLKQYRIHAGLTQQDLEDKSGVSVRSISRLEQGASVQLESLIKILSALNLVNHIDLLIPDQTKRPSFYLKDSENPKQRVRKKAKPDAGCKWGDEE